MTSIRKREIKGGRRRRDSAEDGQDVARSNDEHEAEVLPSAVPSVEQRTTSPPSIPDSKPPVLPDFWDSFNTLYYFGVFLLIGVPIWWVTTTTTYSSLPHSQIAALSTFAQEKGLLRSHQLQDRTVTVVEPAQKWKTFWNLPPLTAVDIVFTLVNPSPEKLKVTWNIEESLTKHLDPVLSRFLPIANFTVSSQVVRYIDAQMAVGSDSETGKKTLTFREAAKIINSVESRLGASSSDKHVLNFIVYVPPPEQQPTTLVDADGAAVPTNAFITPRWGGVMLYTLHGAALPPSERHLVEIDVDSVTKVFLTQFFMHIGLIDTEQKYAANVDFEKDLDALLIKRMQLNVDDSISTLKSLSNLLGQMGNIAINGAVGRNIYEAVDAIKASKKSFAAKDFPGALAHSRRAWEKSEKAFYDPSLLEQLYFPEDQKFAIYVPLFLPACLPVVTSGVKWSMTFLKWRKFNQAQNTKQPLE
ncbi:hypothetical protein RvY_12559 [Ramazzottius varieornatus]|uniref:GPI transamidase component PIG-S n=1 Tax=Ramazzottius varieornatus TaxID=947166 RepID=A0A1D1VJW6_RAMVA|nr:hypothetical protein RvY_12559 [Ramazzottius varieornatus]